MTTRLVVSNSSPLIALQQIDQLDLLAQLFATILVPPEVVQETAPSVVLPDWIVTQSLQQPMREAVLQAQLDAGESAAISLALEVSPQWIILDDLRARRLATSLGLMVIGTLGVLIEAKKRGFLTELRPQLDALLRFHFHLGPELYRHALNLVGELTS